MDAKDAMDAMADLSKDDYGLKLFRTITMAPIVSMAFMVVKLRVFILRYCMS